MSRLSSRSRSQLAGVHPDLVRVVERAIVLTRQDFMVLEGVRTPQRQAELYGRGRTAAQMKAVGLAPTLAKPAEAKVTWTLNSNHFVRADGFGYAVDLAPWPINWQATARFDVMAQAMFQAADELGLAIRWGADWDRDGKPRERGEGDSPHFELAK